LSLQPYLSCFPIAGCVSYRGYFKKTEAEAKAEQLKKQGYDTKVSGILAYSTLGWFNDPLLSSFIGLEEHQLAALLIHEIAHRRLYIQDDTSFNESFATAVEQIGLKLWLQKHTDTETDYTFYLNRLARRQDIRQLMLQTRDKLAAVYQRDDLDDTAKRKLKAEHLAGLAQRFKRYQTDTALNAKQIQWLASINNASLVSLSDYHEYVPAFKALFKQVGFNFEGFYQAAENLAKLPPLERKIQLEKLINR
jgi:predicted aminopeptidase